jgi:8-hydroxy-5-deazaflavin:NADPH oxidoreductase
MNKITIPGSGRVSRSLAAKLSLMGHAVTVGTRDPAQTAADWAAPHIRFAQHSEAVQGASIVVNAMAGATSLASLASLRAGLAATILLDLANAMARGPDGLPARLMYPDDSLAERLQQALPDTAVVKALNTMAFMVMTDPRSVSTPPTAFLSGNQEAAKAAVSSLLLDLGWRPEWIEDLGDITTARATEALALLGPSIVRKRGFVPFAISLAR